MRTFIAIEIPSAGKQKLHEDQKRLQTLLASENLPPVLRWTNTNNLHLTLRFLGETSPLQARAVQDHLQEAATSFDPFDLTLGRLGSFASWSRLRVLWRGIDGETNTLQALQTEIESRVQSAGFAAETKPYTPHITLARVLRDVPRPALKRAARTLEQAASKFQTDQIPVSWHVDRLLHIRSVLARGGAQYTTLAEISLTGDGAAG